MAVLGSSPQQPGIRALQLPRPRWRMEGARGQPARGPGRPKKHPPRPKGRPRKAPDKPGSQVASVDDLGQFLRPLPGSDLQEAWFQSFGRNRPPDTKAEHD
eukprot:7069620-Alexandrium_andersonii.AAC.1